MLELRSQACPRCMDVQVSRPVDDAGMVRSVDSLFAGLPGGTTLRKLDRNCFFGLPQLEELSRELAATYVRRTSQKLQKTGVTPDGPNGGASGKLQTHVATTYCSTWDVIESSSFCL